MEGNQQSWNLVLIFPDLEIEPITCGPISIGKQGTIRVVDGQDAYEIFDQVFNQTNIPLTVPIRNAGENDQEEYLESLISRPDPFNVIASYQDIQGVPRREYTLFNCKLSGGDTNDYDKTAKKANAATFMLAPRKVRRTLPV